MAAQEKSTLRKVAGTLTQAVGKALGLVKTEQKRLSAARRKQLKSEAKKSPSRKNAGKRLIRSPEPEGQDGIR
jgi:hypothetical protein